MHRLVFSCGHFGNYVVENSANFEEDAGFALGVEYFSQALLALLFDQAVIKEWLLVAALCLGIVQIMSVIFPQLLLELAKAVAMELRFASYPIQQYLFLLLFGLLVFVGVVLFLQVGGDARTFALGEAVQFLGLGGEYVGTQHHLPEPLVVHIYASHHPYVALRPFFSPNQCLLSELTR